MMKRGIIVFRSKRRDGKDRTGQKKRMFWWNWRTQIPLFLALGVLLLGACSNPTLDHRSNTSALNSTSTPTMSQIRYQQSNAALQAFSQWIALLQRNGGDAAIYQQQYARDQQALSHTLPTEQYSAVLHTLRAQTEAIKIPAMQQQVTYLQQQLQQQVRAWGQQHQFHDTYNGQMYSQDYAYDEQNGISGPLWLQEDLDAEKTFTDYQQTIKDLSIWWYNFQAMKANFADKTPFNQSHQADTNLLQHYGAENGRAVIISLGEQALRVYDHGTLVKAFQVTTGQPTLPTPPGNWQVESKLHPTIFRSSAPKGSAEWYPDTPITYAMQYHDNGYFLHDAWWRTQFGPGSNYPHQDADGDPFADQGSHGCINMSTDDAAWLYGFLSIGTRVIIY